MGNMKKYKIKAENIKKLERYIKKIENGRNKNKRLNS